LDKLLLAQMVKEILACMEPRYDSLRLKEPVIGPNAESDEPSLHLQEIINFNDILQSTPNSPKCSSSSFNNQNVICISLLHA
jgi:hypothetical protein